MDAKAAFYTAARRYCLERAPGLNPQHEEQWYRDRRWMRRDRKLIDVWGASRGTAAQLDFLGELLVQIEQIVLAAFPGAEALRTHLIGLGQRVLSACEDADVEYEEECRFFQQYIATLSAQDLQAIAPLPDRRVLGEQEQAEIWQRVEQRWGITPKMHWYPFRDVPLPPHVIALQEVWFAYAIPPDALREVLRRHQIHRVWELSQGQVPEQYEMDIAWLIAQPDSLEHCWTSEGLDWLIYTSHEHSITVCGEWLLREVKQLWPEWEDHIYTGYRYDFPFAWERPS